MKNLAGVFIICLTLFTAGHATASDEAAIEKIITGYAQALSDFPKTRDVQSILKFYPEDYAGITDGERETFAQMRKKFSDLREDMDRGTALSISYRVSDIRVHINGEFAWATYDFNANLGKGLLLRKEEHGKCTGIYKTRGDAWTAQHVHCSTQ